MDLQIRQAEDQDYDDIAEMYSYDSVMEQTSQLPYRNAAFWKGFYASKSAESLELVSVCDGKVVGHLGILLSHNPRNKHVGSFGIAVHPDYQGKGVGKALMEELIKLSDNWLNLMKIELDVFSDNDVAVALYKKFDFVIEGECKYSSFKQGQYSHTYKMARFNPRYKLGE